MSQNCLTRSFWAVAALFTALQTTHAQDYSMSIEITGEHTGMVGEVDLTGHTTYQFYIHLADPADQVLTVFGNDENPHGNRGSRRILQQFVCIWPHCCRDFDGRFGSLSVFVLRQLRDHRIEHEPDLGNGESFIIVNEDIEQQWISNLFFPSATSGESIYMNTNGGSWFAMPGATNAIAGDDMSVLIAQFTSQDCLSGVVHVLIDPADGGTRIHFGTTIQLYGVRPHWLQRLHGVQLQSRCANYPGSDADCTYPEEGYDCDGNCLNDTDMDGICDPFEVAGCTDASALNYNPEATDENGFCAYVEDLNCADEAACNYQSFAGPAYCLQIEEFAAHDGVVGTADLTGYTTYRIYALCENADDFVSSVSGDAFSPLESSRAHRSSKVPSVD